MVKLNNMLLMGNLNSLTAIDPNLKQIILDCRAQGSITAMLFSRNMESLYLYTNQNNLISLDLSMFRPCPGLDQIQSVQLLQQLNARLKPPVQVLRNLIVGLKTGEIMKIDPNDYERKEIIADLGKENIK